MPFKNEGKKIRLVANPSLSRKWASKKSIMKSLLERREGYYVKLSQTSRKKSVKERDVLGEIQELLKAYSAVSECLIGLPPTRSHDHAINFLLES